MFCLTGCNACMHGQTSEPRICRAWHPVGWKGGSWVWWAPTGSLGAQQTTLASIDRRVIRWARSDKIGWSCLALAVHCTHFKCHVQYLTHITSLVTNTLLMYSQIHLCAHSRHVLICVSLHNISFHFPKIATF